MNTYFDRYAYPHQLFDDKPDESLNIIVVIPCYNEPDLLVTLDSLNKCQKIAGVEVIVIINEAENSMPEIIAQNQLTLDEIVQWQEKQKLNFNLLYYYLIAPARDAGVGFARKVGMDEAARRFTAIGRPRGTICCFDADTTCKANYLTVVSDNFNQQKDSPNGGVVNFEHKLPQDPFQKEGIVEYELHLRYYENALALINYPFAYQTIGSTMVIRSDIYQKAGGMNKRKAGEDFYFLHRIMPLGKFIKITETTVYPSPRISNRVPFGTGRAMEKWADQKASHLHSYALKSFIDLGELLNNVSLFYKAEPSKYQSQINSMPLPIESYLNEISFSKELHRLHQQSKDLASFTKHWYLFFDGFKVLKYIHHARDNFYDMQPVFLEASKLANMLWPEENKITDAESLLSLYRNKALHP